MGVELLKEKYLLSLQRLLPCEDPEGRWWAPSQEEGPHQSLATLAS